MNIKRFLLVFVAVVIVIVNIAILANKANTAKSDFFSEFFNSLDNTLSKSSETVLEEGSTDDTIAVLTLDTVIQSGDYHDQFMKSLEQIRNSYDTKAVIIKINTPGGGVYESVQIYEKIQEIKKEKNIPFYASMGSIAASGGYYIAVACDKIYAKEETTTGSIGVIMSSMNFSKLFEKYGVTQDVIKSGKFKDIGSSSKPMSNEDRQILQSLVDNSYNKFVKVVADGRKMDENTVRKIADGRIYDGKQALEKNLIDKFGFFDDVLFDVKTDLSLTDPKVVSYDYVEPFNSIFSLMGSVANNLSKSEIQKNIDTLKTMSTNQMYRPMYLYGGM